MNTGWTITCHKCGALISEFSLCNEWFCECGASGEIEYPEDEDEEEST